ncbi:MULTISPECIES: energy-coupling factor ABC transporter ATP-binding protein [Halorubrum]|uniref:Biotin transport system ATP-binding protein n=2 Tax=Halorubrum TaxID=56688 RepID=A0A1I6G1T2_HALSD|nr:MULTISPECIES: ABC transporter ATP-binding protein [Halorubrum]TKX53934.1 ABC transporter ATP-binding protein [Halorubrum sp. SP3]TKX70044.1 ABC transporter ATP-binding protein [Halorubrum sp. SP9]SFR36037.1 biotin transport system ATP-binding protein [Halorubrum sodomense]
MIDLDGVTCRYGRGEDNAESEGATAAVDEVSLAVPDGEFLVVAGANGSGKTTLVRTFNGLVEPDAGHVSVNGTPVEEDLVAARSAVGMVFQDPRDQLVAATVGADVAFGPENLGLSHDEIDRRVDEALAAVNMAGRERERIDSLSGGERERVAIAGALAMEPDHLVLDEPFTGLDEPARRSVVARLRALHREGTSVVVVTHDLRDVAALADRIVGLADGRIAVDAPPEEAVESLPGLDVRVPEGGGIGTQTE